MSLYKNGNPHAPDGLSNERKQADQILMRFNNRNRE